MRISPLPTRTRRILKFPGKIVLVAGTLLVLAGACSGTEPRDLFGTPSGSPLETLQPGTPQSQFATPTPTLLPTPTPSVTPTTEPANPQPSATPRPTRAAPTRAPRTPTPTTIVPPTPAPSLDTFLIYSGGQFRNNFSSLSLDTPSPDPAFEGRLYLGAPTLHKNLYISQNTGEFMSLFAGGNIDLSPYTHVRLTVNSISAQGSWLSVSLAVQPWEAGGNSSVIFVPAGDWYTFSIPIEDLDTFKREFGVRGIGLRGERGPLNNNDNSIALGEVSLVRLNDAISPEVISIRDASASLINIEFSERTSGLGTGSFLVTSATDPAYSAGKAPLSAEAYESGRFAQLRLDPPMLDGAEYMVTVSGISDSSGNVIAASTHTVRPDVNTVMLSVDAARNVNTFGSKIRGVTMQTTSWIWGDIVAPNSARRAALLEAASRIKPGVIRFAGGPWVNSTGWDRADAAPADGDWSFTEPGSGKSFDYRHAYKPEMIDSYAAFAMELGAETIVQVNICDGNPAMWADLVSYTNVEHNYAFTYWELGDRIDENECVSVFEYAERFAEYSSAMKAVDPAIMIMGPSPTQPQRTHWLETLRSHPLARPDALSFQWYQLLEWTSNRTSFAYEIGSVDALLSYNTEAGDGCWIGFGCDTGSVDPTELDRMSFRRGIAEAMAQGVLDRITGPNSGIETAITEFGVHGSQPENPVNGNHIAAIWLADMMARWAYNGLDILAYNGLESGGSGKGQATGVIGIDDAGSLDIRPTYYTRWLYANHFGDVMVQSSTSDPMQKVVIWASKDSSDQNVLKLMIVNLSGERAAVNVNVSGFNPVSGDAYLMTSTAPTSTTNPASFADHETSINGVVIPDVTVANPDAFAGIVDSIKPMPLAVGANFAMELQPYSVAAVTLRR